MNPIVILVPAAALILGPRLWVNHVLQQHNRREQGFPVTARELAREVLDRYQLQTVQVECTDLGDHYDPDARAVRLARDKIDRKTLTAVTTAAHEVSHALQHASGYPPFIWRRKLASIARIAGEAGMVMLLAAPVVARVSGHSLPPRIIGSAAFSMLGTGMVAQLSALPSELNASFGRALPILRDGYVNAAQLKDARKILIACSLTYIATSMVVVLNFWPWLGRRPAYIRTRKPTGVVPLIATSNVTTVRDRDHCSRTVARVIHKGKCKRTGIAERVVRRYGKPLIRGWMRFSRGL